MKMAEFFCHNRALQSELDERTLNLSFPRTNYEIPIVHFDLPHKIHWHVSFSILSDIILQILLSHYKGTFIESSKEKRSIFLDSSEALNLIILHFYKVCNETNVLSNRSIWKPIHMKIFDEQNWCVI